MAEVLVLGAGVVGLTAALVLQERGHAVTVWTREPTAATTSAVAAAIWLPYLAEPRDRVLRWSAETYARLSQLALDPHTGVQMVTMREVFTTPPARPWWADAVRDLREVDPRELTAPLQSAVEATVPLCDTRRHLPWLQQRLRDGGCRIELRAVRTLDEAFAKCERVVNCTGLGARDLCGDDSLRPVRGQVLRVAGAALPYALIDDTAGSPCYLLPRGDDTVLGGTAQPGDSRIETDAADSVRILDTCARHAPALRGVTPTGVAVGLRPWRPSVRLECEDRGPGRTLVHDYGHGGSGFTLAFGCAAEVADLIAQTP